MARSQYPIDGKLGKAWKVTSKFGWRIHPIKKTKKHHNGVDIWQGKEPTYLEACFDGKVVAVYRTTNPNSSGNRVDVQSTVMGKKITWTYFHMVDGSIKVKKGQRITAGTVVGKMGATGFATGKHVHWEIWQGHRTSQPNINNGGKGFYDPMAFMKAAIEWEKVHADAPLETPADAPVSVMPAHSVEPAPAAPVALFAPIKVGAKGVSVKIVQRKVGATPDGVYGPLTAKAVATWQIANGLTGTGIVDQATWIKIEGK